MSIRARSNGRAITASTASRPFSAISQVQPNISSSLPATKRLVALSSTTSTCRVSCGVGSAMAGAGAALSVATRSGRRT